jgi:hypothetical protein
MPLTRKNGFMPIGNKRYITDLVEMGENKMDEIATQRR